MFKHAADELPGYGILDVERMRKADAFAVQSGVASLALMERAGESVAHAIMRRWGPRRVAVLCGPGNNGGDGYAAACVLAAQGWPVTLFQFGERSRLQGDAAQMAQRWTGPVEPLDAFRPGAFEMVIDALFGAGLSRPLDGDGAAVISAVNSAALVRVAVDVPSGVNGDSAKADGVVFDAALTATFHRLKPAHLFEPARSLCGEISCADIGIPPGWQADAPPLARLSHLAGLSLPDMPHQSAAHKHQRGRLCVLAGGAGATSAARLSAEAGLAMGAGLVTLLCPPSSLMEATGVALPVMTRALREESFAEALTHHRADACVLGPGAGLGERLKDRVIEALKTGIALVLDADALSVFADAPSRLMDALHGKAVLTPHSGEFERLFPGLLNQSVSPLDAAKHAAAASGAIVLLKGPASVIAAPNGEAFINAHASARLATAGSGDVLAGMIGGLLAQRIGPFEATVSAAWLHGQAGFLLPPGANAQDLTRQIPVVLGAALDERARQRVLGWLLR
ncbi:MAG: NAD(P)HX epimerase / NAD(P)HX dehydratase [Oceanicaulis sp. HLUCCA04]|nr:MAG: NAD(P)HX epimerase / NAD(P)HX dehydratase [Oceanicaulis sp. HLUCCA04]